MLQTKSKQLILLTALGLCLVVIATLFIPLKTNASAYNSESIEQASIKEQLKDINEKYDAKNIQSSDNQTIASKNEDVFDLYDFRGMLIGLFIMLGVCFAAVCIALLRNINGYQGVEIRFKRAKAEGGGAEDE